LWLILRRSPQLKFMQRRGFNGEKSNNNYYLEIDSRELVRILYQPLSKGTGGRTQKSLIKIAGNSTDNGILHHAPKIHGVTATETFISTVILFC
jgi:hypothetical protein